MTQKRIYSALSFNKAFYIGLAVAILIHITTLLNPYFKKEEISTQRPDTPVMHAEKVYIVPPSPPPEAPPVVKKVVRAKIIPKVVEKPIEEQPPEPEPIPEPVTESAPVAVAEPVVEAPPPAPPVVKEPPKPSAGHRIMCSNSSATRWERATISSFLRNWDSTKANLSRLFLSSAT